MKLTRLLLIAFLFALSAISYPASGPQDSTRLSSAELKAVSRLLVELEWRRVNDSLNGRIIANYEAATSSFAAERSAWESKEQTYKKYIEDSRPPWWNNFLTGAGAASILLTIILIVK